MSMILVAEMKCRQNVGSRKLLITFLPFAILLGTISTAPLINRSCLGGVLDVRFTREPDEHDFYCRDICTENFKHYEKVCLNDPNVMKHCAAFVNCTITPATTPPPIPDSASLALKIAVPTAVIAGIILLAIIILVIKKFHHRFLNNKIPNENQEEAGEHEDQALMDNPGDDNGRNEDNKDGKAADSVSTCVQAVDRNKSSLVHVVPNKLEKHHDS